MTTPRSANTFEYNKAFRNTGMRAHLTRSRFSGLCDMFAATPTFRGMLT